MPGSKEVAKAIDELLKVAEKGSAHEALLRGYQVGIVANPTQKFVDSLLPELSKIRSEMGEAANRAAKTKRVPVPSGGAGARATLPSTSEREAERQAVNLASIETDIADTQAALADAQGRAKPFADRLLVEDGMRLATSSREALDLNRPALARKFLEAAKEKLTRILPTERKQLAHDIAETEEALRRAGIASTSEEQTAAVQRGLAYVQEARTEMKLGHIGTAGSAVGAAKREFINAVESTGSTMEQIAITEQALSDLRLVGTPEAVRAADEGSRLLQAARQEIEAGRLVPAQRLNQAALNALPPPYAAAAKRGATERKEMMITLKDEARKASERYVAEIMAGRPDRALEWQRQQERLEQLARNLEILPVRIAKEALVWIRANPGKALAATAGVAFALYIGKLTTFPGFYLEETSQQNGWNLFGVADKSVLDRVKNPRDMAEDEFMVWEREAERLIKELERTAALQKEFNATWMVQIAPPTRMALEAWARSTDDKAKSARAMVNSAKAIRIRASRGEAIGPITFEMKESVEAVKGAIWDVKNWHDLVREHIGARDWNAAWVFQKRMETAQAIAEKMYSDRLIDLTALGFDVVYKGGLELNKSRIMSDSRMIELRGNVPEEGPTIQVPPTGFPMPPGTSVTPASAGTAPSIDEQIAAEMAKMAAERASQPGRHR